MKYFNLLSFIILGVILISCKETPTAPNESNEIKFKISHNIISHDNGYKVAFKGTLYGNIDSLKVLVPDVFLFGTGGKTIVKYALPDTFTYAKREYIFERDMYPQDHKVYMIIQLVGGRVIYSDTLDLNLP